MKKGRVLWGIIFVLILLQASTLAYFLNEKADSLPASRNLVNDVVIEQPYAAEVKDQVITMEELVQRLLQDYGEQVLDEMINRTLIFTEAEQLGIKIPEAEIEKEMGLLRQGYSSEEEFYQEIENQIGIGPEDLREEIEYYLLLEEMATKDIVITDEQIQAYYEENEDIFIIPARYHLHQIIVATEDEAREVVNEISQGSSFEAVAAERSTDLITSSKGGDMGFVSSADYFLTEAIIQVAESIAIGTVSDPIPVEDGYAVIKVTERYDGGKQALEEVKTKIRRELALQQIEGIQVFLEHLQENAGIIRHLK